LAVAIYRDDVLLVGIANYLAAVSARNGGAGLQGGEEGGGRAASRTGEKRRGGEG